MRSFVLTPGQLRTLLVRDAIVPDAASPLVAVPTAAVLDPDSSEFRSLVGRGLVVRTPDGWRVNGLTRAALVTSARPHEVLSISTLGERRAGYTVCRRANLFTECTVSVEGLAKFAVPLSRSMVLLSLTSALSSDRPEPEPTGFRYRGSGESVFVLRVLLDAAREPGGLTSAGLAALVSAGLDDWRRTIGIASIIGVEPLRALGSDERALAATVDELKRGGAVEERSGTLRPSAAAAASLSAKVVAGFTVGRRLPGPAGPQQHVMQVFRSGVRTVVLRVVARRREPVFELVEVDRASLRALVAAAMLDERMLRSIEVGGLVLEPVPGLPVKTLVGRRVPARATAGATAPPPEAPPGGPPWAPTHTVPPSGLAAWLEPDSRAEPAATLDPRLPVAVTARSGDWARIVCSNGWTAWVDGRALERIGSDDG